MLAVTALPLLFPVPFSLALTPVAYTLTLSDADTALTYFPGTISPHLSDIATTWVDHRGRRISNVKVPSPGDFVWGPDESEHATAMAGANVSVSFAGTRVEWYGHVSEGTTLSVGLGAADGATEGEGSERSEVKPPAADNTVAEPPAYLLASAEGPFGAHTASLSLISGNLNISSVVLTLGVPAQSAESVAWVNQSGVLNGAINPFFTAPEWEPKPTVADINWANIRGRSGPPAEWLNMTVPANTTLLIVNGASDPRETRYDHFVSPGGKLPSVDVHRSWVNPVVHTMVSLDPTVQYEYSILPTFAEQLKIGGVSFLTVCGAGCPLAESEGVPIVGAGGLLQASSERGGSATGSGSGTGSEAPASPNAHSGKSKPNAGAIAGGVVGGVGGLALLALLAVWFRRRRANSKSANTFNDDKIDLVGMPGSPESGARISGGRAYEHRVTPYEPQSGAGWSQLDSLHSSQSTGVRGARQPSPSAPHGVFDPTQSSDMGTTAAAPVGGDSAHLPPQSPLEVEYKRNLTARQLSIPGVEAHNPNLLAPSSGGVHHKRNLLAMAPLSPGVVSDHQPHSFAGRLNTPAPASPQSLQPSTPSAHQLSPAAQEITVHANDAGPVHVNVLPPMYNPDWNGRE